jgi:hypothetical protein
MISKRTKNRRNQGVSLIEAVIGITVFIIISVGVYEAYRSMYAIIGVTRQKITAIALANEQLEIVRNLPYADVGIKDGIPAGKILHEQDVVRAGVSFKVLTTVRNIDDPFDGTIGGEPNDLSPADYKLVQIDVGCPSCKQFQNFFLATYVSPRGLEMSSTNGAILVKVFDADGKPIEGASVEIKNSLANPVIDILDTTNNEGSLTVIDVPPGNEAYEISVTKNGYSSEKTYATTIENPHPTKPYATVSAQQLTQISFSIDKTSTLTVSAVNQSCDGVADANFTLNGTKLIGEPDIPKYSENKITGSNGEIIIPQMEWGNYNITSSDALLENALYYPPLPINLSPNEERKQTLVTPLGEGITAYSLVVDVKDILSGEDVLSPTITLKQGEVSFEQNISCSPENYYLFTNLLPESYHLIVSAPGYVSYEADVVIAGPWQPVNIQLQK